MIETIGVSFREGGKVYTFAAGGIPYKTGDPVIVETSRGLEFGVVSTPNRQLEPTDILGTLKPVIRRATAQDQKKVEQDRAKEKEAFDICRKKIEKHKLEMKLVTAEYAFDDSKILFYFTAEGRIDFRELVKDLASVFRMRIELRQIGVRDEARMLGGLGVCGRPFCCSTFLGEFHPVSIRMAKDQGLSLNPVKISGICGRLMCCLKYEQNAYEELLKITPRVGSSVRYGQEKATVVDLNLLSGQISLRMEKSPEGGLLVIHRSELKLLRDGKKKSGENVQEQNGAGEDES